MQQHTMKSLPPLTYCWNLKFSLSGCIVYYSYYYVVFYSQEKIIISLIYVLKLVTSHYECSKWEHTHLNDIYLWIILLYGLDGFAIIYIYDTSYDWCNV